MMTAALLIAFFVAGLLLGYFLARKVMTFQMIPHLDRLRQDLIRREGLLDKRREAVNKEAARIDEFRGDATFLRNERDRLQAELDSVTGEPNRRRLHWLASQLSAQLAVYDPNVMRFGAVGRDDKAVDAEMGES